MEDHKTRIAFLLYSISIAGVKYKKKDHKYLEKWWEEALPSCRDKYLRIAERVLKEASNKIN